MENHAQSQHTENYSNGIQWKIMVNSSYNSAFGELWHNLTVDLQNAIIFENSSFRLRE